MLLVHPVRELARFLPVLLGVVVAGRASGEQPWQLLVVAAPVVLGLLRYLTTRFRLHDGRVELRRGLLSRHVLSTPLDRVRSVDLTASPVHRVLGLVTVRIGTGTVSSDRDDALDLDGLPAGRARDLRRRLLASASLDGPVDPTSPGTPAAPPRHWAGHRPGDRPSDRPGHQPTDRTVLRLDPAWVRFAPLTGSGLVIAAAALGGLFQLVNTLGLQARLARDRPSLPASPVVAVAGGLLLALVVVVLLSVVGYVVANAGYTLTRAGGSWHVRRGLLTTRETSLARERVAGVVLGEPLALRLAEGAHLTAVVSGVDRRERGGAMLVPPAPAAVVAATATTVLGAAAPVTARLTTHGAAASRRRYTRALVPAAVLVGLLVLLAEADGGPAWLPWLALPVVAASLLLAADRTAGLGHALVGGHLVARSGSLARRREVLDVQHVIGWTLRATWWQRRVGLTTLVATTAGGRQRVVVLDVPEDEALRLAGAATPGLLTPFAADEPVTATRATSPSH